MKTNPLFLSLAFIGAVSLIARMASSCTRSAEAKATAAVAAESLVERGRYLINVSGCNDCHTPGFMQQGTAIPETERLTGVPLGWRGPWGTSYASNLRRALAPYENAGDWIKMVRSRQGLPPMPWPSLHAMTEADLTALHAYIRSLPVTGEVMPAPVGPDQEPKTPYLRMEPVMPR